jgi:hypothetical protein
MYLNLCVTKVHVPRNRTDQCIIDAAVWPEAAQRVYCLRTDTEIELELYLHREVIPRWEGILLIELSLMECVQHQRSPTIHIQQRD